MKSGITIPGRKGFQKSGTKPPTSSTSPKSPADAARRKQKRESARRQRTKTHAVILRFPHDVHADLERVALAAGEHVGTWMRKRVEAALAEAINEAEVRS